MTATKIDLTSGEQVQGTLPVASGGTGAATLTGLVKGSGTSALTAVTAPSGAVVGTTDSQTLTNKTLSGASNTLSSIPTSALVLSGAAGASVATSETTTSTSYADLTTTTDTVTVTVGASGMVEVFLSCGLNISSTNACIVGFAVSGANTQAAGDPYLIELVSGVAGGSQAIFGAPYLLTGLTAGSTTFKMKYRVTGGTGTFFNRRIAAIPL